MVTHRNGDTLFGAPPGGYQAFQPRLPGIQAHGERTIRALSFSGTQGVCEIGCVVETESPEVVNASASRIGSTGGKPKYRITLKSGLPYQAFCFAYGLKTFAPELSWFHELRLDTRRAPPGGLVVDALVEHALFVMCAFAFHHELAHIYMGHIDYLLAARSRAELYEAEDAPPLSSEELRAMEAEADRKAVLMTAGEFALLLGQDRLGAMGVRFPRESAAWDLFCLSLTLLCVLMQRKSGRNLSYSHPDANERSFVMFSFIDEYFARIGRSETDRLRFRDSNTTSRLHYAARLGLQGGATYEGHRTAYNFVSNVGDTLKRMGVTAYRMELR